MEQEQSLWETRIAFDPSPLENFPKNTFVSPKILILIFICWIEQSLRDDLCQTWNISISEIKVEIEHSNHEMKYIKANIFKIGRNLADFSWFWRWEMSQCTMGNGYNGTMLEYGSLQRKVQYQSSKNP